MGGGDVMGIGTEPWVGRADQEGPWEGRPGTYSSGNDSGNYQRLCSLGCCIVFVGSLGWL